MLLLITSLIFIVLCIVVIVLVSITYKNNTYFPPLIIKKSEMIDGRGVFSTRALKKGKIIEKCPIIEDTWDNISNTVFKDYVFNHGNNVVLPIGNCIMVNHSYNPNVSVTHSGDYYVIIPLRNIKKGEELTVNYGKHWWNERKNIPIVDM